jgi:hypothetical protein
VAVAGRAAEPVDHGLGEQDEGDHPGRAAHPVRMTWWGPVGETVTGDRAAAPACTRGASMTDPSSSRPDVDTSRVAYGNSPDPTGWTGWVVFASCMMILLGSFQAIEGLVAIFEDDYYHVAPSGLVLNIDYSAWGWTHLLLGALIVLAGIGVLAGNVLSRIVLAGISAILNLVFIAAYPVWSVLIITVDVLVIYALIVHGRELRDSDV